MLPQNNCPGLFSQLSGGIIPMYKVKVQHGIEDPIVNTKERYDQAHAFFVAECRNAAGVAATVSTPASQITVSLHDAEGNVIKSVVVVPYTKQ